MTLIGNPTRVSEQQFESIGEVSIFIKTTGSREEMLKLIALMRTSLQSTVDPALIRSEEVTEAVRTGTQRTCRVFYKIYRLPDEDSQSESG